ncbi:hypothetical protein EYC84_005874 [Monilinia fructicola]|uniref:Uncharacterized protein n=1 Tax=Monilinia fructicola TaxID=38448 RepID=A0A5M9JXY9_MONFR|nr:hypothetical protein EYC84_005874 [Monilinia fructicola]
MLHTVCFDHIQHTIKQVDDKPCIKNRSGIYKTKTINGECSLKNGQVLGDGRAFHHGSSRVRNVWEFERDPDDPKSLWQRWERKKHDKAHHRSDSMDCNVSAGEDRMKLEADDDDGNSHGEGGKTVKDWPESTKKLKDSRFKVAEDTRKEQPAAGRKTVNHVLESPSSDGFSSDMDRTAVEESKIKVETNDTTLWSPTPSRSFSDSTIINTSTSVGKGHKRVNSRKDKDGMKFLERADIHRPPPPRTENFNFNPPFTGVHTYMSGVSHSRNGSGSAYTGDDHMDRGSPEPKGKKKAIRYDSYRPKYPTSPPDFNTSFYAGDAAHANDKKTKAKNFAGHSSSTNSGGYQGPSDFTERGGASTVRGLTGYASSGEESKGVFGNYAATDSYEREKKKVRVHRDESEERGENDEELMGMSREHGNDMMDEGAKQMVVDPLDIAEDIEMKE